MVFQSERESGNPFYQIYVLDLETGDVERVSPGIGKTTCAWFHPSGERVLYASTHKDPEAEAKMRAQLEFRASGQERRYAWDYDENFDIYAQDLAAGGRVNLTRRRGYDAEGAYSPDGRQIVFASNRHAYDGGLTAEEAAIFEHDRSYMMELYLMDADGGNVRRLTEAPGYDGGPFFSADGRRITWRRFSRDGATAEIYTMELARGEGRQVTRMGVMSWAPFFHPSGDYLIFASNREGFANFELFLVDAEGSREPVRVTWTGGFDGLPVFSPDGERLAWTSNRGPGKVAAYRNMDMVGQLRDSAFVQGTGSSSVWPREIERRNVPVGLPLTLQADPYLPTDATPFYMKGVPVLNLFTGAHEDYSSPRDTPDALDYEGIRDIARLVAGIGRSLARATEDPDYFDVERQDPGLERRHLRPYLGTIPAYGQDDSVKGVKLQGTVKGGPADRAGVRGGDVVVALAGVEVTTIHDFMGALSGLKVGEQTELEVVRNGERVRLEVIPGARE